jgi:hypothetical protein
MGLDDFRQQRCRSDADCSRAQTAFGDAERCDFYVCQQGACVPQHGTGAETCNGEDDDCNGLIDDGVTVIPRALTGTSSPDAVMAYAFSPSGAPAAYVVGGVPIDDGERGVHLTVVNGTVQGPAEPLVYASAAMARSQQPCPVNTVSAGVGASACRFDEVALGADQEQLVYATINTVGCGKGQLRVGLAAASDPFRIWLGSSPAGAAPKSDLEVGVDVGDGSCSGNSVLDENGVAAGARSPAVAVLDASPGGAGALVTWLATEFSAVPLASCETPVEVPVPVRALAVMVPEDAREADERWLIGSDGGIPVEIGQSSSLRPPAVVGLEAQAGSGRYLVAFPSTTGDAEGLALVFLALEGGHVSIEKEPFIEDEQPDLVALSSGTSDGTVALAWRSGCGPTSELKLLLLSAEGSPLDGYPLSLGTGDIVSRPQLLHASDGFTTQGKRGGWYVSWSEQLEGVGRTRLARLSDEPSPVRPEIFTVTSGALGFPLLFPGEDSMVNQGLVTITNTEAPDIRVFAGWCQ